MRTLLLSELEVTMARILVLSDIFTSATKLKSLSFGYCEMQLDEAEPTMETILGFTRNFKNFWLQSTPLNDATLSRIIENIAVNNPLLEELNFAGSYCGDLSLRYIAKCLQHENFLKLSLRDPDGDHQIGTYLQLHGNPHARDFSVLANAVHNGCPLQEVAICCKMPAAEFESLLSILLWCPTASLNFKTIDVDTLAHDVM
jgi:hypothetical protein